MVWMPARCPICKSDKRSARALCENHDDAGVPCHGLSDEQAAVKAAQMAFERDEITLDELERRVEAALENPPRRRFSLVLELR